MVPSALARALGLSVDVLVVRCEAERLVAEHRSGGRNERQLAVRFADMDSAQLATEFRQLLSDFEPERMRIALNLDESHALQRLVRVPRAAEEELDGVLSYEIERYTPYRAGEALFVYTVDRDASDEDTLAVGLTVVPRDIVRTLLRGFQSADLTPNSVIVTVSEGSGRPRALPLDGDDLGVSPRRLGGAVRILGAMALVLGVFALGAPLLRLHVVSADLDAAVVEARDRAAASHGPRADVERIQVTAHQLARTKAVSPSAIRVFEALSALLPDGTWLRHVSLVKNEVLIEGMTDSSARLVALLENSPLFGSVNYVAPVTRERGGRIERFSFSLALTQD